MNKTLEDILANLSEEVRETQHEESPRVLEIIKGFKAELESASHARRATIECECASVQAWLVNALKEIGDRDTLNPSAPETIKSPPPEFDSDYPKT